jgi:hypothetical protein
MADKDDPLRIPNILEQAEAFTAAKRAKQKEARLKKKREDQRLRRQRLKSTNNTMNTPAPKGKAQEVDPNLALIAASASKLAERREAHTLRLQQKMQEDERKAEEEHQALVSYATRETPLTSSQVFTPASTPKKTTTMSGKKIILRSPTLGTVEEDKQQQDPQHVPIRPVKLDLGNTADPSLPTEKSLLLGVFNGKQFDFYRREFDDDEDEIIKIVQVGNCLVVWTTKGITSWAFLQKGNLYGHSVITVKETLDLPQGVTIENIQGSPAGLVVLDQDGGVFLFDYNGKGKFDDVVQLDMDPMGAITISDTGVVSGFKKEELQNKKVFATLQVFGVPGNDMPTGHLNKERSHVEFVSGGSRPLCLSYVKTTKGALMKALVHHCVNNTFEGISKFRKVDSVVGIAASDEATFVCKSNGQVVRSTDGTTWNDAKDVSKSSHEDYLVSNIVAGNGFVVGPSMFQNGKIVGIRYENDQPIAFEVGTKFNITEVMDMSASGAFVAFYVEHEVADQKMPASDENDDDDNSAK